MYMMNMIFWFLLFFGFFQNFLFLPLGMGVEHILFEEDFIFLLIHGLNNFLFSLLLNFPFFEGLLVLFKKFFNYKFMNYCCFFIFLIFIQVFFEFILKISKNLFYFYNILIDFCMIVLIYIYQIKISIIYIIFLLYNIIKFYIRTNLIIYLK